MNIKEYSDRITDVMSLLEEEEVKVQLASLIEELSNEASKGSDPNIFYLLGYAWYSYPEDTDQRDAGVVKNLKRAIELDENHSFSNLYLGHYYFDVQKYVEAIRFFEKLDSNFFCQIDQEWRNLKNQELILCCKIYILGCDFTDKEFKRELVHFIEYYISIYEIEIPFTLELFRALSACLNSGKLKKELEVLLDKLCEVQEVEIDNSGYIID